MKKTICLKKNLRIIQKLWTELSFLFERKQCNEFYTDVSINLNRYFLKGKHPLHILMLETGFAVTKSYLLQKGISALIFASVARNYRSEPSPLHSPLSFPLLNTFIVEGVCRITSFSFSSICVKPAHKNIFSPLVPLVKASGQEKWNVSK